MDSANTAINSSKAIPEKAEPEREKVVATSSNSTRNSTHNDADTSRLAPVSHTTPESTQNGELVDAYIFAEEEEDDSESDDKIPEFEGGEPRGRVVNPIAGVKPKPPRPLSTDNKYAWASTGRLSYRSSESDHLDARLHN